MIKLDYNFFGGLNHGQKLKIKGHLDIIDFQNTSHNSIFDSAKHIKGILRNSHHGG